MKFCIATLTHRYEDRDVYLRKSNKYNIVYILTHIDINKDVYLIFI
jgi:hypothetical protein